MRSHRSSRPGMAWLELLLFLAIVVLLLQLFPSVAIAIRDALDVRNWSMVTWFVLNALLFLILCAIRYGPDVVAGTRSGRDEASAQRTRKRREREAIERRKKAEEERKLYARMQEARKRQV